MKRAPAISSRWWTSRACACVFMHGGQFKKMLLPAAALSRDGHCINIRLLSMWFKLHCLRPYHIAYVHITLPTSISRCLQFWYRRLLLRDCELLRSVEADAAHKGQIKLIGGPSAATMPDPSALVWVCYFYWSSGNRCWAHKGHVNNHWRLLCNCNDVWLRNASACAVGLIGWVWIVSVCEVAHIRAKKMAIKGPSAATMPDPSKSVLVC